jgi:hypothetical protein
MTRNLRELVTDCTVELFRAYGVVLDPQLTAKGLPEAMTVDTAVTAVMDARLGPVAGVLAPTSPGKLAIVTSFALVAASRPMATKVAVLSPTSFGDWLYVRDWIRELMNQLAGRIMNRLAASGTSVAFGRPVALTRDAALRELAAPTNIRVRLGSRDHVNGVELLVNIPGEIDGKTRIGTLPPPALEGSVTLFDEDADGQ